VLSVYVLEEKWLRGCSPQFVLLEFHYEIKLFGRRYFQII